ncbi:MAG: GNAT family N-acetyltransferase [Chlamydiae bacterium]|nr:GNAT family N-acetyltransferase [Chlamydiota bacterium]
MTFLTDFDIRYSEMEDLPTLQKWFQKESACDAFPFGPDEAEESLKNWIGFSKYKAGLTGTLQGEIVAIGTLFLMPYKKVAHHSSFYLIVAEEQRRKGIGESMVKNLLHLAKTRFRLEAVHVEIFEPSPFLSLLKKMGFELLARQENFTHLNGEKHSRIIMGRHL